MRNHPIGLDRKLRHATPRQREVHDLIAQGPRRGVPTPFFAMLDAPELAVAVQDVGVALRFKGVLSDAQRELAILATAGAVKCAYEWDYHFPLARDAGVSEDAIAATRTDALPPDLDRPSSLIIAFCKTVALKRRVEAELRDATIELIGRTGTTELVAIAGYYSLLASFIFIGGHEEP